MYWVLYHLVQMQSVAQAIRQSLGTLTRSERQVAHALLANYPLLGLRTVADMASEAGVSPPTVLRFVSRLGFDGYAGFQDRLHSELSDQLKAPLQKELDDVDSDAGGSVARAIGRNVVDTLSEIPASEVEEVVELLRSSRRPIVLTGGRFTDPLASYMAAHLTLMRPRVSHLGRSIDERRDRLVDMGRGTTVVVFDIRRYDDDLLAFSEAATGRGAEVILFTDEWLSPVSRHASRVLSARVRTSSIWDSNASLMAIVELVLAGVARSSWPRTRQRLEELERLRQPPLEGQGAAGEA